jgi:hypothetical protein
VGRIQDAQARTRKAADAQQQLDMQYAQRRRNKQMETRHSLDDAMLQYQRAQEQEQFRVQQEEAKRNLYLAEVWGLMCRLEYV